MIKVETKNGVMLYICPSDAKVVFSNDNGYTYGNLGNNTIKFTYTM